MSSVLPVRQTGTLYYCTWQTNSELCNTNSALYYLSDKQELCTTVLVRQTVSSVIQTVPYTTCQTNIEVRTTFSTQGTLYFCTCQTRRELCTTCQTNIALYYLPEKQCSVLYYYLSDKQCSVLPVRQKGELYTVIQMNPNSVPPVKQTGSSVLPMFLYRLICKLAFFLNFSLLVRKKI